MNDFLTLKRVFERLAHIDEFLAVFRPFGPIFLIVTWFLVEVIFDRYRIKMQTSEIEATMFLRS